MVAIKTPFITNFNRRLQQISLISHVIPMSIEYKLSSSIQAKSIKYKRVAWFNCFIKCKVQFNFHFFIFFRSASIYLCYTFQVKTIVTILMVMLLNYWYWMLPESANLSNNLETLIEFNKWANLLEEDEETWPDLVQHTKLILTWNQI